MHLRYSSRHPEVKKKKKKKTFLIALSVSTSGSRILVAVDFACSGASFGAPHHTLARSLALGGAPAEDKDLDLDLGQDENQDQDQGWLVHPSSGSSSPARRSRIEGNIFCPAVDSKPSTVSPHAVLSRKRRSSKSLSSTSSRIIHAWSVRSTIVCGAHNGNGDGGGVDVDELRC